jgi:hypothetical protein
VRAYNPVGAEMCINQECNIKNGMTDMLPQTIQTPVKRKQIVVDDMGNAVIEEIRTGDADLKYRHIMNGYSTRTRKNLKIVLSLCGAEQKVLNG